MSLFLHRLGILKAAVASITQVLNATSNSETIDFPAGIKKGDLIALLDRARSANTPPEDVTPSGFTRIGSSLTATVALAGTRQNLWWKLADGTETGSLTGMNGGQANDKAMYVFRGNVPAETITVGDPDGEIQDTGDVSEQVCGASSGVAPLVVIAAYGVRPSGTVDPRSFDPAKDGEINPSNSTYLAYKIYNTSPADVTIDMEDEGNANTLQSCFLQMK